MLAVSAPDTRLWVAGGLMIYSSSVGLYYYLRGDRSLYLHGTTGPNAISGSLRAVSVAVLHCSVLVLVWPQLLILAGIAVSMR